MKIAHKLAHLFYPRESNNHKAKVLHPSSLTLISLLLICYQVLLWFTPKVVPSILGYAANIAPAEVVRLTNIERAKQGLSALTENSTLSQAAQAKGADMLAKSYWAHIAPDGTTPWKFFGDFGYKYRYAGENLARDFATPQSAVDAWMASPTHRENIMSSRYSEIGIAVVEGSLAGVDTTMIVQFFGTKAADIVPQPLAYIKEAAAASESSVLQTQTSNEETEKPAGQSAVITTQKNETVVPKTEIPVTRVNISPFSITKNISLIIIGLVFVVLLVDWIVVYRRKIPRISGRNFAHLAFLGMVLAIVIILKAGQII